MMVGFFILGVTLIIVVTIIGIRIDDGLCRIHETLKWILRKLDT